MRFFFHFVSRLILYAVAMVYCIAALTPPIRAVARSDSNYEISIDLVFVDDKEHTEADYQDVLFIIQNSDLKYLQVEYDQTADAYIVTGYVDRENNATPIRCSWKDDQSGQLLITGLKEDNYTITNIQVPDGYSLLNDPIIVEISDDAASVNGNLLDKFDGRQVSFRINITKSFILPLYPRYDPVLDIIVEVLFSLGLSFVSALLLYGYFKRKNKC